MGRQKRLKGTEDPAAIPELTQAAEAYEEARDARMKHTEEEDSAKQALIEVMKRHKRKVYSDGDLTVTLESDVNEKVKVKRRDNETEEAAE